MGPTEHDLPPTGRRVIAVGGGKGGVGKSLVAASLAVYLAQLGKRVVLVDADPTGANLHLSLGVAGYDDRPRQPIDLAAAPERRIEDALAITSVAGLRLLVAPTDPSSSGALKAARKLRLLQSLRDIPADDIVIDVGPGTSTVPLDLFLAADIGVLVTVPEPASIETTYRFLRAAFVRDLRRALRSERTRLRALDRALSEVGYLAYPIELTKHLLRVEPPIGEIALSTLGRLRPLLVVNQTRVRTDLELGVWMAQVAARRLGIRIDFLGHVEHDDAVWLANRRRRPLVVDGPSSKSGRNLERIARRMLAVFPRRGRERESEPVSLEMPTYYELLMIQRGSSEEEVRRAHKRQREIYAFEGLPTASIYTEEELAREHALLDEANDVLLDPQRRRAYDVSVFPDHEGGRPAPSPATRAVSDAVAAELVQLRAAVAREIGPDTEFSGALLRRVREARGAELRDVAATTKIAQAHLAAVEEEAFDRLPPLVYVRGFLIEMAKFLRLDPTVVARTYLRRARDLLELRG